MNVSLVSKRTIVMDVCTVDREIFIIKRENRARQTFPDLRYQLKFFNEWFSLTCVLGSSHHHHLFSLLSLTFQQLLFILCVREESRLP